MKKLRAGIGWLVGVLLALGFAACVVAALCDQKPGRGGRLLLTAPHP